MSSRSRTASVASFSPERTPTTFDDEETKISYNSLTDLYLPAKRPPSQTIVTNIGNAATCSSLTLSTSVYLLTNKLDDDGLDYLFFEKEDSGPDTLHTPEKTYERRGTCRYIFEDDRGFVMYSKRGWLNCASLVLIISTLLFVFVVWPVWRKVGNQRNRDPLSQFESDLTRQSGPFLSTDLPTRGST
ncbi:hypothetical protein PCASD_21600 [Puccinia coronata f. sp. avenae]|uniref:Uncharacterized protein n=1 Tax=Puccinia coronata f. sp. avenae TaxID=200324 RepID=A0A2N5SWE5_9BASI|nr:hypothetical protein PCASD_21600 [Puccinia coronata f. sp. avenae]